jgi:outer membrane protein insertion porin family
MLRAHPRSSRIPLLLAFLLIISGTGLSQEDCRVRGIDFSGNDTFSKSELLEHTEMYEKSWFSESILQQDPFIFSDKVFDTDLQKIKEYYQREGFLRVLIRQPLLEADNEGRTVDISIPIVEGPPITVDSMGWACPESDSLEGPSARSLVQTVGPSLSLVPPARFRDDLVAADQKTIIRAFLEGGFPFVTVHENLQVDTVKNTVLISWDIRPGPRARFGNIRFSGDTRIRQSLLDNRIAFAAGDMFNQKKLEQTQDDLYGLPQFRIVNVKALLEEREDDRIPIEVNLQEAVSFRARVGVGYGKEEKFRVLGQLTWLGVLWGPGKLDLEVKHSALEAYSVGGKYTHPDFLVPKLTLSLYPYTRRELEPAYTNTRLGISVSIERKILRAVLISLMQTFERVELDTGSISPLSQEGNLLERYPKSSIMLGMIRSTGKPLLDPKDGTYESLVVMYSGLGSQSPYQFLKTNADLRRFDRLTGELILASRLKIGAIQSYNQDGFVPMEERFYAGGSTSVRGWGRYMLGPLDDAGQPLGGKSLLEGSLECRFPIGGILGGVLFVDYGNVWQASFDYRINELRYSAGVGARFETAIGPIRLDWAVPIFEGKQRGSFFFSIGQAF